jgi:hypothetical protein
VLSAFPRNHSPVHRQQATFLRAALLLGLESGQRAVRWADSLIPGETDALKALVGLALTNPEDVTALRAALLPLSREPEPVATLLAILGRVAREVEIGARGVRDSVALLRQIRLRLALPDSLAEQLDALQDDYMLAAAGVGRCVASVEERVRAWLAQFAGAEEAVLGGLAYHLVPFPRAAEAEDFLAALSRFLASPAGLAAVGPNGPLEVWGARECEAVTLFLNPTAAAAAEWAFAPLAEAGTCTADAWSPGTTRLLFGRRFAARGLHAAERHLASRWR